MKPLLAVMALAAFACSKSEKKPTKGETDTPPAKTDETNAGKTDSPPAKETDAPDKPKVELLDEATSRRLHVDRAEASSFLWNDWNRFQENYHPLYLADDDPKTAWVEGAEGPGTGQWIRLHVTPVEAATAVRLELRNGYHKSKSLFKKNARAKKLTVQLLPSGTSKQFDLPDSMEVATLELEQPSGELRGLEITVDEVYGGSKYADLCLSDVELHVTSRTPENPAFEKAKLDKVRAWKQERLDAAKLFASKEGKAMPVGTSYRVVGSAKLDKLKRPGDKLASALAMTDAALAKLGGDKGVLERAKAALGSGFDGWKPVSAAVKKGRSVPAIDGLHVPDAYELLGPDSRDDSYTLPLPGYVEFLTSSRISLFEATKSVGVKAALAGKTAACKRETDKPTYYYFQPPESGGVTTEILVIQCGMVEERDGYYGYTALQLVEYDETGKLAAVIDPVSVTSFSWDGDKVKAGTRLRTNYSNVLFSDKLVAKK